MSSLQKNKTNKILIVDDEADVLDFLQIYLESLSWEVETVDSPQAAFEALNRETFFLTITDIAMPDMDGYEFVTKLQEMGHKCEVALMTGFGYNPNHTLVKIHKNHKYPCLFKPFNRKKVAETAQNAWEKYHQDIS